jgi:hypothetical protein
MAITVATVVNAIQAHFADISQAMCLSLLNDVHNDLLEDARLTPDTTVTINLTVGTQEYALPDTVLRVWESSYATSAGNSSTLKQISVDELDYLHRGWRTEPTGTPSMMYERGGMVGFYPCPDTTTAGGFPLVTLYVSQQTATLDISASLPATARTANAWTYEVCKRFAAMQHPDQFAMFAALAKGERERLIEYIYGRLARDKATVMVRIPPPRRV